MRALVFALLLTFAGCGALDVFEPADPLVADCVPQFCMSAEIWKKLGSDWSANYNEVYYCMQGDRSVTRLLKPEQVGYRNIVYPTQCPGGTFGNVHTHPSGSCILNDGDLRHFAFYPKHQVAMVVCGADRFGYQMKGDSYDYIKVYPDSMRRVRGT